MALANTPEAPPPALSDDQLEALRAGSAHKLAAMREAIRARGSALVAFSAGVDSTFVLAVAVQELGERAVGLTALSASVAPDEVAEAKALAAQLRARHLLVESKELDDPRYAANPSNRCYFCKTELYTLAGKARAELGLAVVLDGFNADDKKDWRPGHQAAKEHAISSPLAEAGLTKHEIRAWSKQLGLPTWDKPQLACLASRLPYGTQVTVERLSKVGAAEKALKGLGLKTFRVRYHGEVARLEVAAEELPRLEHAAFRAEVDRAVKACGFTFVCVDLEPFRTGRMNDALKGVPLPVL